MKVDEFYDMLPIEFWHKVEGFYEIINFNQRREWERVRWQTTLLLNPHVRKGKTLKPKDLIVFDWEKEEKDIDFEELKNKAEYMKKLSEYGK